MKKLPLLIIALLLSTSASANEPVIVKVEASVQSQNGTRNFNVTVRHEDTGWKHYADRFEILSMDDEILATRVLAHPHVNEQPFTREKYGVRIPEQAKSIMVRAHDSVHGYGPAITIPVPAADKPIRLHP